MEPTAREREIKRAAELFKFGLTKAGCPVPAWLNCSLSEQYPSDDMAVVQLCLWLRNMPEELANRVMYDGRDKTSRELADWWDEHKAADAARAAKEAEAARMVQVREAAIARLTPEERQALGVK